MATDDVEATEIFVHNFGDAVVFYKDSLRSNGNVSVAFVNKNMILRMK